MSRPSGLDLCRQGPGHHGLLFGGNRGTEGKLGFPDFFQRSPYECFWSGLPRPLISCGFVLPPPQGRRDAMSSVES